MRVVGNYNGHDIFLEDMQITYSYSGVLVGGADLVLRNLGWWVERSSVCPNDFEYHVVDEEKYMDIRLPEEKVVAFFRSAKIEGKGAGMWSGVALVWFQGDDSDPIEEAKKNLKKIDWEDIAMNWEW
nr:hypothetical protein 7 [bacterium]